MQQAKIGMHVMLFGVILIWVHMTALRFHWYWHMRWFDSVSHFIGGILAAFVLIFFSYIYYESRDGDTEKAFSASVIIFGTFIIGILWEVFEHIFVVSIDPITSLDTVIDLGVDTLGALVVWWYVQKGAFTHKKDI